jgi:hypothetical protein
MTLELPYKHRISEHVEDIERVQRIAELLEGEMLDSAARELARCSTYIDR